LPVTSIGDGAFQDCASLTNVTIPNSVVTIGDYAFQFCNGLTNIWIGTNVTSIGLEAFDACGSLTSVEIPNSVTSIGVWAFQSCGRLNSVMIGTDVTNIGFNAFSDCASLSAIMVAANNPAYSSVAGVLFNRSQTTLIVYPQGKAGGRYAVPNSVTNLGDFAFGSCTSLTNVTIGSNVTSIGQGAFASCGSLISIIIPNGVTSIGDDAFQFCGCLTSVSIGASVTNLGPSAFDGCTNLSAIMVAANNPAYNSEHGVLFNRNQTTLIEYPQGKAGGNYTIPATVTSIGPGAFQSCDTLISITIPNGVTSIGSGAFRFCDRLTNVTIGASVTNLGFYTFAGCTSLSAIMVAANNPAYSSENGVLFNQDLTTLLLYPAGKTDSSYTIPNGVINLGDEAFHSCGNLTSVTIPTSVINIVADAFAWCNNLAAIFFEGDAPDTDWDTFNSDNNLTVYYLPDTSGWSSTLAGTPTTPWDPSVGLLQATISPIVAIWAGAQWQVDNGTWQSSGTTMPNLSLGEHTVSFSTVAGWTTPPDQTVFVSSKAIATVTGTYEFIPFDYTTTNGTITIISYIGYPGEATVPRTITIPGTINGLLVTGIGNSFFLFGGSMTNLTIPSSVTNIAHGALQYCPSLTTVTVDPGNPAYSSVAGVLFNQSQTTLIHYPADKAGSSYTIPSSVTNISDFAFYGCSNLTSVAFGGSVVSIGNDAFENTRLSNVVFGSGVTSVGEFAFAHCPRLVSVTIPNSVTNIGFEAFQNCSSLMAINVDTPNLAYGSLAGVLFNKRQTTLIQYPDDKAGTAYTIPNSVTNIGQAAFQYCANLTSVVLGSQVVSIGSSAFANTRLNQITIPDSVTSIGVGAFSDCVNLSRIMIGSGVTNLWAYLPGSESPDEWVLEIEAQRLQELQDGMGPDDPFGGFGMEGSAFYHCTNLTAIDVDALNPAYCSAAGVLFNKNRTLLIQYPDHNAGDSYTIPGSVNNIGDSAFQFCATLTSVTIGKSVTNIGDAAFANCTRLTGVNLPNSVNSLGDEAFYGCTSLTNVTFGTNVTSIGAGAFGNCTRLSSLTMPNSVTSIEDNSFYGCTNLTSVTFGNGVTNIEDSAFAFCPSLKGVFFQGNAPNVDTNLFAGAVFGGDTNATAYYLAGTAGWGPTFGGIPTALWNPQVRNDASFGVRTNCFGFNLTGLSNQVIVVEACTNLFHPLWQPVQTNTLTGGSLYFSDPQWTDHPTRFYRVRSP